METTTFETSEGKLDTWNQPRSVEQLLGFIARREAEIFNETEQDKL